MTSSTPQLADVCWLATLVPVQLHSQAEGYTIFAACAGGVLTDADIEALLQDIEQQILEDIQAELAELERHNQEQMQHEASMAEQHMQQSAQGMCMAKDVTSRLSQPHVEHVAQDEHFGGPEFGIPFCQHVQEVWHLTLNDACNLLLPCRS